MIEIKNRGTDKVMHTVPNAETVRQAVIKLVQDGANLTSADLSGADLRGANLIGAYLRGADLRGAKLSSADLTGADLTGADLSGADLRGAILIGADLRGADLRGAKLSSAYLIGADLRGAYLRGADLTGANGKKIKIPVIKNIDAAILAAIKSAKPKDGGAALRMNDWHHCKMAHCRGGWAITLAGRAGAALEDAMGVDAAAALIYAVSRPDKRVPDFFSSDDNAMADIEACAAEQLGAQNG